MKSQIGTSYNLSKQYNFYCTDLTVDKLENFSYGLPNNAIIISSPTDRDSYDMGTPSILMTDYNSNIMPLTYTLDKSQFERVGKTNKIKFRESIIDTKFTTYYNLLKRIENNVNLKHKAVSYFYYDIYDYYNDISTYYDGVSDYYDTISYYHNEIVKMYDDIKGLYDKVEELVQNIESSGNTTPPPRQTRPPQPPSGGGLPGGSGGSQLPDSPVNTLPPSSGGNNQTETRPSETLPPNN